MSFATVHAMAPSLPAKSPGRLGRINTADTSSRDGLPSEQVDVWEHATLLYHGYEWQAAAETFLYLSRAIESDLESALCLLNAALIFARLGDYAIAAHVLDEADPEDETLALTTFIIGHIEFELGHFQKSEESLKVALGALNGPVQRFARLGLDYELRATHIEQCLRIFETGLQDIVGSLGAIPADGVFESPERLSSRSVPSSTNRSSSIDSSMLPTLTESSLPSYPVSPIESRRSFEFEQEHGRPTVCGLGTIKSLEYTNHDVQWHAPPNETKEPVVSITPPKRVPGLVRKLSTRHNPQNNTLRRGGFWVREPREARIQGDSVGGLAEFFRSTRPQNSMEPRRAEGEATSTNQLATFFTDSGPAQQMRPSDSPSSDPTTSSHNLQAESISSADLAHEVGLRGRSSLAAGDQFRNGGISALIEQSRAYTPSIPRAASIRSFVPSVFSSGAKTSRDTGAEQPRVEPRPTPLDRTSSLRPSTLRKTAQKKKPSEVSPRAESQKTEEIGYAQYFGSFGKHFM